MGSPATNLDDVRDENLPFSPAPVTDWINAHVDEMHAQYSGQHVAIDPTLGALTFNAGRS